MSWRARSACLGVDAELFFPSRGDTDGIAAALAVCAGCEVVELCLADGIEQKDGVLGGTTGAQRRKLRAERGLERLCAQCGAAYTTRNKAVVVCSDECRKARRAEQQAASDVRNKRVPA